MKNVEVINTFAQRCPAVVVTSNRAKADYLVRLDYEAINPITSFTHGNKVAVFGGKDLVYGNSSRLLGTFAKSACGANMTHVCH